MSLSGLLGSQGSATAVRAAGGRVLRASARESRAMLLLLTVATVVQIGTGLLTPVAVGAAIDATIKGDGQTGAIVRLAIVLAVATLAMAADDLLSAYFGSALTAKLRHRLIGQVLSLGVAGQRRFPAGEMLSRLTENAAGPASFLPQLLAACATLLTTVGAVVGLVMIDLRLALTFLIGIPIAIPLLRWFISRAGDSMLQYQQIQADLATRLIDAQRGARTIRAAGAVDRDIERVLEPVAALHERGRRLWAAQRKVSWQFSLLAPLLQVAVLAVGGFMLTGGGISAGQLMAAASYAGLAVGAIGLLDTVVALLTCQTGAGRVGEVLEVGPTVTEPAYPIPLPNGNGDLELREVTVRLENRTVLNGLNIVVPAGTNVALVGRSGSGKTALTGLIGRLLDPDEGSVLLEGTDVSTVELNQLRNAVSYAFERPALLGKTIADMIGYGRNGARRKEIEDAAQLAQADGFIRLLPDGYDTSLALSPMSGGELQRLGLASAALTDARILVLDDATSSLDTATELRVARALQRARVGRTCLTIAHRAGTAARADLVAWLEDGRVRSLAPHDELWRHPDYRAVFSADQPHDTMDQPRSPNQAHGPTSAQVTERDDTNATVQARI